MAARKNNGFDLVASIATYKHDPELRIPHRIAHFLSWAAIHVPKHYFQYNVILKAIQGYVQIPRMDNKEIELVRSAMYRSKLILRDKYKRGFISLRGHGVRATVDHMDTTNTDLRDKAKKVISAKVNLDKTASLVDVKQLPNTDEGRKARIFFNEVVNLSKSIDDDRINKLLPPKKLNRKVMDETNISP